MPLACGIPCAHPTYGTSCAPCLWGSLLPPYLRDFLYLPVGTHWFGAGDSGTVQAAAAEVWRQAGQAGSRNTCWGLGGLLAPKSPRGE